MELLVSVYISREESFFVKNEERMRKIFTETTLRRMLVFTQPKYILNHP